MKLRTAWPLMASLVMGCPGPSASSADAGAAPNACLQVGGHYTLGGTGFDCTPMTIPSSAWADRSEMCLWQQGCELSTGGVHGTATPTGYVLDVEGFITEGQGDRVRTTAECTAVSSDGGLTESCIIRRPSSGTTVGTCNFAWVRQEAPSDARAVCCPPTDLASCGEHERCAAALDESELITACVAPASQPVDEGAPCAFQGSTDNCAAGLICARGTRSTTERRCYRICQEGRDCGADQACMPIVGVASLPLGTCDATCALWSSTCGPDATCTRFSAAHSQDGSGAAALCRPVGTQIPYVDACTWHDTCPADHECLTLPGSSPSFTTCVAYCDPGHACPMGRTCTPFAEDGGTPGHCL